VAIPSGYTLVGKHIDVDGTSVNVFKGVPFAEAPVGNLRFRPSVLKEGPTGDDDAVFYAQSSPPRCLTKTGDEDCLFLNVWAPENSNSGTSSAENIDNDITLFPVMVYIHGGGYFLGSIGDSRWDGKSFAANNVIVVTVQYRLHWLGNLDLAPIFGRRHVKDQYPNLGLDDQRVALQWVQQNIRALGGDPDNVTIFGHSSGASYVMCHLASGPSQPLFHKAIVQSGSHINTKIAGIGLSLAVRHIMLQIEKDVRCAEYVNDFISNILCRFFAGIGPDFDWWQNTADSSTLEEVYTKTRANAGLRSVGVVTAGLGYDICDAPYRVLQSKRNCFGDDKVVMAGIVMDEALSLFTTFPNYPGLDGSQDDCGALADTAVFTSPTLLATDIIKEDPSNTDKPGRREAWTDKRAVWGIIAEIVFGMPTKAILDAHKGPTYSYVVDRPNLSGSACRGPGTNHGAEHNSIWNRNIGTEDIVEMHYAWINFVTNGAPGNMTVGNTTIEWREYDEDDNQFTMIISKDLRWRSDPFGPERREIEKLLFLECAYLTPVGALVIRPICAHNPIYAFVLDITTFPRGFGAVRHYRQAEKDMEKVMALPSSADSP